MENAKLDRTCGNSDGESQVLMANVNIAEWLSAALTSLWMSQQLVEGSLLSILTSISGTQLTQGLGKQPFHSRVVVLVNERTNSAGEMAAQFAKDTKLALIVGKQTRGNVLGSTMFNVGHGYQLYLPIFGWYSPSGNYTEGSGVRPDVSIDIDPDRLAYGEDAQVNKAQELLE